MPPAKHRIATLKRSELPTDTIRLARTLIGKLVVRKTADGMMTGRIVETEAYPPGDPAGHAFVGMTERNSALFLTRGHAYVYRAYGVSWMLNVSSATTGVGGGVLIRALEPVDGIALMQRNRSLDKLHDLARGPGRLALAFDIDRALNGIDLCRKGPLWLARDDHPALKIGVSTRIGLTRAADKRLRFYARGNAFVSGPRSLNR